MNVYETAPSLASMRISFNTGYTQAVQSVLSYLGTASFVDMRPNERAELVCYWSGNFVGLGTLFSALKMNVIESTTFVEELRYYHLYGDDWDLRFYVSDDDYDSPYRLTFSSGKDRYDVDVNDTFRLFFVMEQEGLHITLMMPNHSVIVTGIVAGFKS